MELNCKSSLKVAGPRAMPWKRKVDEICQSQDSSDSLTKQADHFHQNTDSDSDGEKEQPKKSVWWAKLFQDHGEALGLNFPPATPGGRPVQLVSCCSGALSEGAAYKASR